MKKSIIVVFVVLLFIGCGSNLSVEKYSITKIEVFYIPFDVLSPVQSDEQPLRKIPSFMISDAHEIDEIMAQVKNLKNSGFNKKLNRNHLYLACDFYEKEGKAFSLLYDKNIINIQGDDYGENKNLIEFLIKNKRTNFFK